MTQVPDNAQTRLGEYVLGTLDAAERRAVERELASDPALRRAVADWERRLAPLAQAVPAVEPGPQVWAGILRRLDTETQTEVTPLASAKIITIPRRAGDDIDRLHRHLRRWQVSALAAGALAACLALFIVASFSGFGPRRAGGQYLAVVNRGGELPALVVRVDTRNGTVQVRPLGAEAPARDRSLELWYIAPGGAQAPRSLGVLDDAPSSRPMPIARVGGNVELGTIAVTVEPKGGSTTGGPTGPVVYSGKLVKDEP